VRPGEVRAVPAGDRAGHALFVYGTLMFGEVVEGLIGRSPPAAAAVLPGWRAARLPGRVYPGLVPAHAGQASGRVMSGLRPDEWAVLDDFEGDAYQLCEVSTVLVAGTTCRPGAAGRQRPALTYAWRDVGDVEAEDWDPSWFAATWLDHYATRVRDQ
jgi:gamma-glutamylcyclotransferase (GGCT)/AIG2-like uncharacterized protein YtfP